MELVILGLALVVAGMLLLARSGLEHEARIDRLERHHPTIKREREKL